jgi:hypothetical protein
MAPAVSGGGAGGGDPDGLPALEAVRLADELEAAAWADYVAAAPPAIAGALGLAAEEVGGATLLLAPAIPSSLFNRAIGLGVRRPATEADVDAIVERYRSAGCREAWIHLGPASAPAELAGWLTARGLALARRPRWAKVVRGAEPAPAISTALAIRPLAAADGPAFAEVLAAAFEMPASFGPWNQALIGRPGWRTYGAFEPAGGPEDGGAGRLVAVAAMHLAGGRAWLGFGGTRPDARRRGGQGALMARRIADAIAAGCSFLATETGEPVDGEANPSLANMYRCGFRRACSRLNFRLESGR